MRTGSALRGGRNYVYEPVADPAGPWDGILAIDRWIGGLVPRADSERYAVREIAAGDARDRRTFLVCSESRAPDFDSPAGRGAAERAGLVHRCSLTREARHCTCPDFGAGRICGHLLALGDFVGHGDFVDPAGDDPREAGDPAELDDAQASDPRGAAGPWPDPESDSDPDPSADPGPPGGGPVVPGNPGAAGELGGGSSYDYTPIPDRSRPWDGVLTITRTTGSRIARAAIDRYGIEEQPPEGFPGRVFLICKLDRTGDLGAVAARRAAERCGAVYRCSIGHHIRECTCPGSAAGGRSCKHIRALAGCVGHGGFPDPLRREHPEAHPP